jgi:hypothetical protein
MIRLQDNEPSRIHAAVEWLKKGEGVAIADYDLVLLPSGDVVVGVATEWLYNKVTLDMAERELADAQTWFATHLHEMGELGEFLKGRRFKFSLHCDYGTGSYPLPFETGFAALGDESRETRLQRFVRRCIRGH